MASRFTSKRVRHRPPPLRTGSASRVTAVYRSAPAIHVCASVGAAAGTVYESVRGGSEIGSGGGAGDRGSENGGGGGGGGGGGRANGGGGEGGARVMAAARAGVGSTRAAHARATPSCARWRATTLTARAAWMHRTAAVARYQVTSQAGQGTSMPPTRMSPTAGTKSSAPAASAAASSRVARPRMAPCPRVAASSRQPPTSATTCATSSTAAACATPCMAPPVWCGAACRATGPLEPARIAPCHPTLFTAM